MIPLLYGIPNCDTVKKARAWLAEQQIDHEFIDFKKSPPNAALIERWLTQIPLDTLLNRRGTTWRKLNEELRTAAADPAVAIRLMCEQPSLIKRPVLEANGHYAAGFMPEHYAAMLAD